MDDHDEEKRTEHNLIVRCCKTEAKLINSRRLRSTYCTIATAELSYLSDKNAKGPFIATQLNSTQQREQLTQFVGRDVINKNITDLAVRCSTGSVELS